MIANLKVPIENTQTADKIAGILAEKQWTEEKGLEILLAYGLAYILIKEQFLIEKINLDETTADLIIKKHIENEGRYSSYKFKNYQLIRDNKTLESRNTGLSCENQNLKASIKSVSEGE